MEPKLPTPISGGERPSVAPQANAEYGPVGAQPERAVEYGDDRHEQRGEMLTTSAPATALPVPVVAPLPPPAGDDASTTVGGDDNPVVAADDDLIEKEWVDRAKKIIQQTKDDPFRREQEVSRLQADYLKKRYGKELGATQ